jgi:hypothetical protein
MKVNIIYSNESNTIDEARLKLIYRKYGEKILEMEFKEKLERTKGNNEERLSEGRR